MISYHVEPVVKVLSKPAFLDLFFEIPIGGGEDSGVGDNLGVRANALESPVLGNVKQFGLKLGRHLGDFIEENRPILRFFKTPAPLIDGAAESAFFMSEKFSFEQRLWNRRAVDLDQRSGTASAPGVNDVGHDFFSDAAFSSDEHPAL